MSAVTANAADIVGLITKTETNPFFVKMREGAEAKAKELGIELRTAAGKFDGDNDAQVAAIENLISAGAKGIRHRAGELRGDRADDQEGARCRPAGHRARHAARSDGRRQRDIRDRQPRGRRNDRRSGRKGDRRQGEGRQDRVPGPRPNQPTVDYLRDQGFMRASASM